MIRSFFYFQLLSEAYRTTGYNYLGDFIFSFVCISLFPSGYSKCLCDDFCNQVLRVLDYSRISRHLLATAGDDGSVHLWDTTGRSPKVCYTVVKMYRDSITFEILRYSMMFINGTSFSVDLLR